MSVVARTALGCLCFLDLNQIARSVNPHAVGALLLAANVAYFAWMLGLIHRDRLPQARLLRA